MNNETSYILVFAFGERPLGELQGVTDDKSAKAYFEAECLNWPETQRPTTIKKVTSKVLMEQKDVKFPEAPTPVEPTVAE